MPKLVQDFAEGLLDAHRYKAQPLSDPYPRHERQSLGSYNRTRTPRTAQII